MHRTGAIVLFALVACASTLPQSTSDDVSADQSDQPVRIAIATSVTQAQFAFTGPWVIYNKTSEHIVTRGGGDARVKVQMSGGRLMAVRDDGSATSRYTGSFIVRSTSPGALVRYDGKRYRGEIIVLPTDSGMLIVNRLAVESYLRGVVPLEIGDRKPGEEAAVQAQAVAARSYSYVHMSEARGRAFDMYGTVQDQVYGGADAEKPIADDAVVATRDMVLRYAGRIINTPYHSTCGGSTAAVQEVWWREPNQPYLQPVSDRIPGTNSFYCDPSPRFKWNTTFQKDALRATLDKYLTQYSSGGPAGSVGAVTGVRVEGRTQSDRVSAITISTTRGNYLVRGNDIRFVLRSPAGTILNSTYFTAETTVDGSREVSTLTLNGGGYGHGIGMCQWGAIGRARAGQDYKTILTTYYPGTTVSRID
ncbi:MAG: SpoIID/LytB domain-containing protein [Gemmatimonadales bacterium]